MQTVSLQFLGKPPQLALRVLETRSPPQRRTIAMLSKSLQFSLAAGAALLLLPDAATAQVNVQWATFTKQPSKISVAGTALSDSDTHVLFRDADLDQDTWDDVVAMRKQQASQPGKRPSFLLMNVNGVLTDKTAL